MVFKTDIIYLKIMIRLEARCTAVVFFLGALRDAVTVCLISSTDCKGKNERVVSLLLPIGNDIFEKK